MNEQTESVKRTATKNSPISSFFALASSLLLGMILIDISGYSSLESYKVVSGISLRTIEEFALPLSQATPIMLTGLSSALAHRVCTINIGTEGQPYIGAMTATLVRAYITNLSGVIHMSLAPLAAIVVGGAVAFFIVLVRVRFGANKVIIALVLNEII